MQNDWTIMYCIGTYRGSVPGLVVRLASWLNWSDPIVTGYKSSNVYFSLPQNPYREKGISSIQGKHHWRDLLG